MRSTAARGRIATIAVLVATVAAFTACGTTSGDGFLTPIGSGGGSNGDTVAPTVVSTNPANGASSVPRNATISVTFSENLDSASVTNTAFSLDNGVTGTIVVNGAIATLTPSPGLPASSVVTGTLSTAIKDRAGNSLAAPVVFQFVTAP
jgi:hypothetical protein